MGNCQAIDAAALVIQHPDGKIERLYWPVTASEVMRTNPGHYVSLIIPLPSSQPDPQNQDPQLHDHHEKRDLHLRLTRVKLLRPTDTLALGHAYRLITSQEVMKVLRAKKYAKTKRQQQHQDQDQTQTRESVNDNLHTLHEKRISCSGAGAGAEKQQIKPADKENTNQTMKHKRHLPRIAPVNQAAMRSKSWRPSLQSISEAPS